MSARAVFLSFAASAVVATLGGSARADDDYRRPGLEGQWSHRHLTAPMNSLRIVAGPGQPMLMGERFGTQIPEGGGQVVHDPALATGATSDRTQTWLRGGVAFGLTPDWECGALFIPLEFDPKVTFSNITVFITRGFRFDNVDLGLRLSFQTPHKDSGGGRVWDMNPGVPLVVRAGAVRFDSAVFVPFATRDWWIGLNVPVRVAWSLTPHWFVATESGFVVPKFEEAHRTTVPLGWLAGWTGLFGSKVVDLTAMFSWDSFLRPSPSEGEHTVSPSAYRVGLGVVYHSLVR
jgi:hypothetical protein